MPANGSTEKQNSSRKAAKAQSQKQESCLRFKKLFAALRLGVRFQFGL
jgi:hypothetical protein